MILIHCPYCDETLPELEFAYAGEAHIARPLDPAGLSDEEWERYLFIRANPKQAHAAPGRAVCSPGLARTSFPSPEVATAPASTPKRGRLRTQMEFKSRCSRIGVERYGSSARRRNAARKGDDMSMASRHRAG